MVSHTSKTREELQAIRDQVAKIYRDNKVTGVFTVMDFKASVIPDLGAVGLESLAFYHIQFEHPFSFVTHENGEDKILNFNAKTKDEMEYSECLLDGMGSMIKQVIILLSQAYMNARSLRLKSLAGKQ